MTVTVNGTCENRWARYGLRHNPFPALPLSTAPIPAQMQLASLDGDPVRSAVDITERLRGFSREFVALVIDQWRPGERVTFTVTFPAERAEP